MSTVIIGGENLSLTPMFLKIADISKYELLKLSEISHPKRSLL